ncbi:MAG: retropepsin-like domain-containing protein [Ignavibacteria bacterium]|nr:retropepsin-like domain-containing protein [Ignavibacteria bacterium]
MKKLYFIILNLLIVTSMPAQTNFETAFSLYENEKYFELIKFYNLHEKSFDEKESDILKGLILSLQNKPEKSNEILKKFQNTGNLDYNKIKSILLSMVNNYVHLYDYKSASEITDYYLKNYSNKILPKDKEEVENSQIIWKGFSETQPQEIIYTGTKKINYTKDIAGLMNIKVKSNNEDSEFVFDTGANFSTVTKSTAEKLKMKFVKGKIKVGTITGIKVDGELSYAEEFYIQDVLCKNVLFLVLPDETLSFGGGIYKISGIIGLPLIKDLGELIINKDGYMNISKVSNSSEFQNLLLDGFTPVIEVIYNNDSLDFTFDTGARQTLLYYPFYEKYKTFVEKNYEVTEVKFGGAGGEKVFKGYKIDKLKFSIGNSKGDLEDISLIKEIIKDDKKKMFGNLGQDYIKQFDNMLINFKDMKVNFY